MDDDLDDWKGQWRCPGCGEVHNASAVHDCSCGWPYNAPPYSQPHDDTPKERA